MTRVESPESRVQGQTYFVGLDRGGVGVAGPRPSTLDPQLSYDATEPKNKRREPSGNLQSEDAHLHSASRKKLLANSRDLIRNYAVVGWACRKHLDFVASHTLNITSPDRGLNKDIESMFAEWGDDCDVQGRLDFCDFARLAEARRTVDGDVGIVHLASGLLQGIEGERIKNPPKSDDTWTHGVKTDSAGRAQRYAIHQRKNGTGLEFEREVSAANLHLLGYFDRFDQVRGVSPMAPALNSFRDSYETQVLAIARAKVANMFGLIFYRDSEDAAGQISEADTSEDDFGKKKYEVDFGKGPVVLDLDPNDRAEFLKNETGAVDHGAMIKITLQLALLCLDLPWAFLDAAEANYNSMRSALILYQKSCNHKRRGMRRWLRRVHRWKMAQWLQSGQLVLPKSMNPRELVIEWISDGVPWWDPAKETRADLLAIGAGLKTRTEVRRERYGDSWLNVLDQLKSEQDAIEQSGVVLMDLSRTLNGEGSGNSETSDNTGVTRK